MADHRASARQAVVLVDGEHYLPNLADSLRELASTFRIGMVLFIGGTEKIGSFTAVRDRLPYPVAAAFGEEGPDLDAVARHLSRCGAELVIDLSDEPVVDYPARFRLANLALHHGMEYRGADFSFHPHRFKNLLTKPSLALWGTGKRIGKTAMGGFVARTLRQAGYRPGVVTLSRGGPDHPHLLRGDRVAMDPESLLRFQEEGFHAASDYFEDAVTGRCITIGCRRCGGGLAGKPYFTVVEQGARMAEEHPDIDVVVLEGSGATFPEIRTGGVILVLSASQDLTGVTGYFGPYRVMGADLVVVGGCDAPLASPRRVRAMVGTVRELNPGAPVATVVFRPRPLQDIRRRKVFYATTAPAAVVPLLIRHLRRHHGCRVVGWSNALSDRERLARELRLRGGDAEVFLTELKASAVSVVAAEGRNLGKQVVLCDNVPRAVPGGDVDDLEPAVLGLLRRPERDEPRRKVPQQEAPRRESSQQEGAPQ
ncbi:MAG: 2,3-diphosphoglycerate synthetase [Spirochaetota bacterium]